MKKLMILIAMVVTCGLFASCGDDDWSNNNPAEEHTYFYGFENQANPGGNELVYNVAQEETVTIPTRFWSVYKRSYSPVVTYYTSPVPNADPQLVLGTDYQVVDANGAVLTPDANGGYSMTWPNALQGVQNVYIKALKGKTGKIRVLSIDPTKTISAEDVSSTYIVRTDKYNVRTTSENYYVTVNIQ